MKNVLEVIEFAKVYLYPHLRDERPIEEFQLNPKLNYRLCIASDRILAKYGEVTRRDVIFLCESYYMAHSGDLLIHRSLPEKLD